MPRGCDRFEGGAIRAETRTWCWMKGENGGRMGFHRNEGIEVISDSLSTLDGN